MEKNDFVKSASSRRSSITPSKAERPPKRFKTSPNSFIKRGAKPSKEEIPIVDFCCGCGGISLGLQWAG